MQAFTEDTMPFKTVFMEADTEALNRFCTVPPPIGLKVT
jgi:hypothetical protein